MLRPHGYALCIDPVVGDRPLEYDTISCGHCSAIVLVKPGAAATVYLLPTDVPHRYAEVAGAFCGACMTPICLACHARGVCEPLEALLDRLEGRPRRRLVGLRGGRG